MIDGHRYSWPLWATLLCVALPATAAAAVTVAASIWLFTALSGSMAGSGIILAAFYDIARLITHFAVFIGAPISVLALVVLLLTGGYGNYSAERSSQEHLPSFLGRVVVGGALFACIGLICQLMLAAKVGGWF